MASQTNLDAKKIVVNEIIDNVKNSESVILFTYQGLTVSELSELRKELKKCDSDLKVYKNTLVKIALNEMNTNLDEYLEGPNALLFGKDLLEPIKVIDAFAKKNDKVDIRVGIISGSVAQLDEIKNYASIPSREGLLTMLAGGMIQYVKELAIGLNLYAEQKEN